MSKTQNNTLLERESKRFRQFVYHVNTNDSFLYQCRGMKLNWWYENLIILRECTCPQIKLQVRNLIILSISIVHYGT